ncbi:hypothetical protein PB2503_09914 [Parvularcula bermudensis HTCC2503]|uniref:Pyridoxamine 5'-phosphate oxidase N-terminal domain-containing protein n=1 Tax=Parvularcula bermudensis (strain ATCC BAA-594 / HTCC2503 / KCTC 12087) TaxID=314260 RepID=E0TEE9_PARBH|nr:pyridoxamine 5'-phosphate oxidase family protein [Parvularcula bermudensis]ADM10035.1 hypothetical protein PB2503_09914 [Parvularcula bermudensis HTCC2503]
MAQFFDRLDERLIRFIEAQPMFFVATAPPDGRVNLSPKGLDTFRVLTETCVAYLDLVGSGAETAAHLKADGRITIMFNSFGDKPLILRLYGHGRYEDRQSDFAQRNGAAFPDHIAARGYVVVDIDQAQTSCGYAVPKMTLTEERSVLDKWAAQKGEKGLKDYVDTRNRRSIDGLPTGLGTEKEGIS